MFISLFATNFVINFFKQRSIKQYILQDAPQTHMVKQGTPTMGGVAIIFTIVITLLIHKTYLSPFVIITLFLLLGYAAIGAFDDLKKVLNQQNLGLKATPKFILQILIASAFVGCLAASNHFASVSGVLGYLPPVVYYILLVFIIVGASNAVNLTDGLDGLAAGNLIIAFLGLMFFTFFQSDYNMLVMLLAVIGALFGFLWFNVNPARIFMGDTGSLALGAVLAGVAIIMHKELQLIILGIVFVFETLSVILQVSYFKLTKGKRIFKMSPLHHHFELSGWTEPKIVLRFWMVGIVATLIALNIG